MDGIETQSVYFVFSVKGFGRDFSAIHGLGSFVKGFCAFVL
jgi:hypothetical protein